MSGSAAPAVRLFLERSALARAGSAEVAPVAVVARICRALDGLLLAIELAAARAGVLSAEEIEAHLADRFRFLAYLRQVADPRHQALEAAVAETLQACEAAIPVLEAGGDLEGLADAWLMVSKLRFWSGRDPVRTDRALERAAHFARQSANHRAERESTLVLMYNLVVRPIPADEAVSRAESLLQTASGDSWVEQPCSARCRCCTATLAVC